MEQQANLLDIIFKIVISGGGIALAAAAARIAFGWGRMEGKVNKLIEEFRDSLKERTRLVDENKREHEVARRRIDTIERDVSKIKGHLGLNGK